MSYPLVLTRRDATAPPAPASLPGPPSLIALPFELMTPVAPTPFRAGGQKHLVYELHITNLGRGGVVLQQVEVFSDASTLATFAASELHSLLARPGAMSLADNRALGPGLRAIAYIWISLPESAPLPRALQHDNRSHLAYGQEVLAVADAVVSSIHNGMPENVPGSVEGRCGCAGSNKAISVECDASTSSSRG